MMKEKATYRTLYFQMFAAMEDALRPWSGRMPPMPKPCCAGPWPGEKRPTWNRTCFPGQ